MRLLHVLPLRLLVACGGSNGTHEPVTTLTEGDPTGAPSSATDTAGTADTDEVEDTSETNDTSETEGACTSADACRDDGDCDSGQTCLADCTCSDDVEDTEGPGPTADYGPCDACAPGEQPVQLTGHAGCFCAPECSDERSSCPEPTDSTDSTAAPACAVWASGDSPTHCALVCLVGRDNCPSGATCEFVQVDDDGREAGFCTHPTP